ncbi:MAG: FSR family fosmidomycin resistance protein-like MFS transporter [Acidimicrobiales bacterium]
MTATDPEVSTSLVQRLRLPGELGRKPNVLFAFIAAHVVNDFTATSLPAFLPAIEDEFGLGYFELGLLSLTFAVLSGIAQPFLGNFADRNGRRRAALVFGFISTAIGFVAIGAAPVFPLVVLASLFCGLGGSTYHPQATALLVKSYPDERGRTLGFHGWGGSIGHFLAPVVVAVGVTAVGWRWTIAVLAIPSLITALGLHTRLPETNPNPGATLRGAASRDLVVMALTFGLLGMVLRGFLAFLPTYLVERDWSLTQAGAITTLILVVGMFAQPMGGSIFDRIGGRRVFLGAAVGSTASLVLFVVFTGWLALLGVTGMAFFVFALFPVSLAMASEIAGAERTGAAAGIVFGISGLSTATVPAVLGAIADESSLRFALSLLIVVSAGAILMSLGLPDKIRSPD